MLFLCLIASALMLFSKDWMYYVSMIFEFRFSDICHQTDLQTELGQIYCKRHFVLLSEYNF